MKYEPHRYQEETAARMVRDPRLGLFLDPGLGKTSITLEAFRRLRDEMEVRRMLVVAPLRPAYSVWPRELAKWDQFRGLTMRVIHGSTRSIEHLGGADIYVTNPESLEWLAAQRWAHAPEMLVVDESTKFKRKSTQRHRWLRRLIKRHGFERRYILTATPAPRNVADVHGQIHILDDGARLGDTIGDFRERYMVPIPVGAYWDWAPRKGAVGEVGRLIRDICINLRASDHLDLPQLVEVDVPVSLPQEARDAYRRLKEKFIYRVGGQDVVAENIGAIGSKLRQIIAGGLYHPRVGSGRPPWDFVHSAKAEALVDLYEQLGGRPLLVAYEHDFEVSLIRDALMKDVPNIGGGTQDRRAVELEAQWNAGKLPMLLVQPQSGAHGLNLQEGGEHICWFTPPFNAELYWQFNARLHRQGQRASRVVVHRLAADDTMDARTLGVLRNREADQNDFLAVVRAELDS